jgi:hypothetical protein
LPKASANSDNIPNVATAICTREMGRGAAAGIVYGYGATEVGASAVAAWFEAAAFFSICAQVVFAALHSCVDTTLFATSSCGANVCKWAFCTTTSFQLSYYMGCIPHVLVPGQQIMVTMWGCASFLRALGVSQILVF